MKYERLAEYIQHKDSGESGWARKYEKSLYTNGEIIWPNLAGHYSALLEEALDWIPPALRKEILQNYGGER